MDGSMLQPALQVGSERIGTGVAGVGFAAEAGFDDRGQTAAQRFRQGRRIHFATQRSLFRTGLRGGAGERLGFAFQQLQLLCQRGVAGQAERMRATEQAMQHDAQLPDVGGGGDRRRVQLFGRCVFEGQRAVAGGGGLVAFQLLGDAEVEQLDPAFAIDQQVRGLEVAVDDQVAMRMADRVQHLHEQLHALAQVQPARVAPLVDGRAIHVLHDEVGIAVVAEATVQ